MRRWSRFWAMIALFAILLQLPLTIQAVGQMRASGFPDLSPKHWAYETITWAAGRGILSGLPNGHAAPDRLVTQAELTAMLIRAFIPGTDYDKEYKRLRVPAGSAWDQRDYLFAEKMNWAVKADRRTQTVNRGEAAELLVSVMGLNCTKHGAIQYLLDEGLARGKTSASPAGFRAGDPLSRAEAVTFIYRLVQAGVEAAPRPLTASAACTISSQELKDIAVSGVMMHDSEQTVLDRLGQPNLKVISQYGFEWYVYNDDYEHYVQVGIQNGKVVGLLTNARNWQTPQGIGPDSTYQDVVKAYGEPLEYILKGNTRYMQATDHDEQSVYQQKDYYLTFYYDKHEDHRILAVQLIDRRVEEQLKGFYGQASDELAKSFERQVFELANVSRVMHGLAPFTWDDRAAAAARKHSKNMAVQAFFSHTDKARRSPFDRMRSEGIHYSTAAENIAYGQRDALEVHAGWMNSKSGHRESLLGSYERLGVGVYLASDGTPYYTQNFYTPHTVLSLNQ